jgi:hypothetical protein
MNFSSEVIRESFGNREASMQLPGVDDLTGISGWNEMQGPKFTHQL